MAVSYIGRNDLAHVDPSEIGHDVLGSGVDQAKAPAAAPATQMVSRGFTRGNVDRLMLVSGGAMKARNFSSPTSLSTFGATALKEEQETGKAEAEAEAAPGKKLQQGLPYHAHEKLA